MADDADISRHEPCEQLVRTIRCKGVSDERVLSAFRQVPRELFVLPRWRGLAYLDDAIPIAHSQVTTQPSLIATMVEALGLTGHERVLEIGTGSGYQTAILARLCRHVYSVEWFKDLADGARAHLRAAGIHNATIVTGDGTLGLPAHAPYAAIIVSAAATAVPPPLVQQLEEGGRLVQPIGPNGAVIAFRKRRGKLIEEAQLTPACFVELLGVHGARLLNR